MLTCPIPSRLVQLIQSGYFVKIRDLLTDNVQVRYRFEELHSAIGMQLLLVTLRLRVQEVTTLNC